MVRCSSGLPSTQDELLTKSGAEYDQKQCSESKIHFPFSTDYTAACTFPWQQYNISALQWP